MVLVITPLISLMRAQVKALNDAKIPACLVGSAQPDQRIIPKIEKGEFLLIYSSPEFLECEQGRRMLNVLKDRLILIAIDGKFLYFVFLSKLKCIFGAQSI